MGVKFPSIANFDQSRLPDVYIAIPAGRLAG